MLLSGIDPRQHKRAVKEEQGRKEVITFEICCQRLARQQSKVVRSARGPRVLKSLEDNLFDAIGKRNIAELKTRDLLIPIKAVEMSGTY